MAMLMQHFRPTAPSTPGSDIWQSNQGLAQRRAAAQQPTGPIGYGNDVAYPTQSHASTNQPIAMPGAVAPQQAQGGAVYNPARDAYPSANYSQQVSYAGYHGPRSPTGVPIPLYDPAPGHYAYQQPQQPTAPATAGTAGTVPTGTAPTGTIGTLPTGNSLGGITGGTMPTTGGVNVNTSITPGNVYSPQQTQYAVNLAHAQQMRAGNLPSLMAQFAAPGMAINSPAVMAHAVPAAAQAASQASAAQYGIPLQDALANSQHLLAGQTGRENEAQGLARILMGLNNAQLGYQQNQASGLAGLLGQLAGM